MTTMSRQQSKKISEVRTSLRRRAAARNIFSISDLARLVPCSRTAIYESLERPTRFPNVTRRINELVP